MTIHSPVSSPKQKLIISSLCTFYFLFLSFPRRIIFLHRFSVNYTPWLNFSLTREGATSFLDLVCCTVASRYLDASTRDLVAPRLQRLAEDTIARMIFNPELFESQETIKGLIILSLWTPICGPSKGGRDGRMLISMAVSMALNLGLSDASATAISIREKSPYDQAALDEATNKARLVSAPSKRKGFYSSFHSGSPSRPPNQCESSPAAVSVFRFKLSCRLCIGTRRTPQSRRSPSDMSIFPILSPSNISEGRDLRIRLLAEIFNATEQGMAVEFATREDVEAWYNGVSNSLASMDRLCRLILPLSGKYFPF